MRRTAALVALVAFLALAGPALASPVKPCGPRGLLCGTVAVPLDATGAVPGTVGLHVEELPPKTQSRGVVFLLAGGPGQASAEIFDLGEAGEWLQWLLPGYTLVAYDDRGTGRSGPLSCAAPDTSLPAGWPITPGLLCGAALGAAAPFYSTRANADDMDSIRAALGVDRIAVLGVSYGTKQALAYALLHPEHVDRLVLDSVVPPERTDVDLLLASLRELPSAFSVICRPGCPDRPDRLAAELATLANRYEAAPAHVDGAPIRGTELVSLAIATDLSDAVAAELPAAIDAASRGALRPLARLVRIELLERVGVPDYNPFLYVATTCGDGPLPWAAGASAADEQAAVAAAEAALPAGSTGAFGSWVAGYTTAGYCQGWPAASAAPLPAGPLPDVPTLVLAGERDVRTPLSGSAEVAARFPQARFVVARGLGHSVTSSSLCIAGSLRRWWIDGMQPAPCPRVEPAVPPLGRLVSAFAALRPPAGTRGRTGRTLAALEQTLAEARRAALFFDDGATAVPGIAGGSMLRVGRSLRLREYSDVPGVALTGVVDLEPARDSGHVRVSGSAAVSVDAQLDGTTLLARVGGRYAVSLPAPF